MTRSAETTMDDKAFNSVTGSQQVEEPQSADISASTSAAYDQDSATSTASTTPTLSKQPSISSIPTAVSKRSQGLQSASTTTTTSTRPSRETSPRRPPLTQSRTRKVAERAAERSRRKSQDASPARSTSASSSKRKKLNTPVLNLSNAPQLQHLQSEAALDPGVAPKGTPTSDLKEVPRWPTSPRLKSPPLVKPTLVPRKSDQEIPSINVQSSTPTPTSETPQPSPLDGTSDEQLSNNTGMKPAVRGVSGTGSTLATVEETSQPGTPIPGSQHEKLDAGLQRISDPENPIMDAKAGKASESGSDSGGTKGDMKMRSASAAPVIGLRPNTVPPSKSISYSVGTAGRGKPSAEGSTRNMTVETETVSSIPQVAVSGGGPGVNGSLRAKPSSETIRPRKEKRKTARKAPSVTSGMGETSILLPVRPFPHHHHNSLRSPSEYSNTLTDSIGPSPDSGLGGQRSPVRQAGLGIRLQSMNTMLTRTRVGSSKADIFEAKIANAVDEANSSDSEETFVYESNPPEPSNHLRRYHSRTPSATSMVSQLDTRGNTRSVHGGDGGHNVALKKNMKFANNTFCAPAPDATIGEDDGKGTARSNLGTGRGTTHHHHIGRWGRKGGNGHSSLFDNESPFPNVAKSKLPPSRSSSRPTSPRVPKNMYSKRGSPAATGYDIDDGAGADDERTPLMNSTVRSTRSGRNRRPGSSTLRQLEHQVEFEEQTFFSRFSGCLVLLLVIILVIGGAFGFIYATTQPLSDVKVLALRNVLVSQEELMLDMEVMARNPNVVIVSVDSMNVEVFARSRHAGSGWGWFGGPPVVMRRNRRRQDPGNDDPPEADDPDETQTLKLGQLLQFDSPLTFEGSPFSYSHTRAIGSVRLEAPGNTTEDGGADGMEKWGRILKYEFDLRVKGVLEYQLPLSSHIRKASVDFTTRVKPNDVNGPAENRSSVASNMPPTGPLL